MKRLSFVIVALAALAGALWHFQPDLVRPLLERTPLKRHLVASKPLYQWRDPQGRWQVTDEPPAEGIPYEVKRYSLEANVLPLPGGGGERE